ncbi:hypothetical protein B447_15064 [Thauera sp. 27]|nr:hypothetical protein B447_15064 [Thauera sp. 27]
MHYLVVTTRLHACPAVADDEPAWLIRIWNDVDRIVLTLGAQSFGTISDHFRRIDLTRGERIGINERDVNLLVLPFAGVWFGRLPGLDLLGSIGMIAKNLFKRATRSGWQGSHYHAVRSGLLSAFRTQLRVEVVFGQRL